MPKVGEQHSHAAANPFEEVKPHVSEYTAAEIATLASRLEKQLGPEYISSRAGPGGGKVHYLSADKCINLANEVFGFNGWSSSLQNIQVDFVDETEHGRVSLGLSVTLRVTLRDGTYHEDIGYGHIENCKGKAAAFEKSKKEGTTDALKRALRNFGNLLGNCVYDKEYVAKVTKLKAGPTKWDPDNLHRHPDFAPARKETSKELPKQQPDLPHLKHEFPGETDELQATINGPGEDEFGSDDFDAVDFAVSDGDHPDEVMLDTSLSSDRFVKKTNPSKRKHSSESKIGEPHKILRLPSPSLKNNGPQTPSTGRLPPKAQPPLFHQPENPASATTIPTQQTHQNTTSHPHFNPQSLDSSNSTDHEPPIGFFTARAAASLQAGPNPAIKAPPFNPHLESPSIRKTAGVDHTRTKPVNRDLTEAAPPPPAASIAIATSGAPPPPPPPPQQRGNLLNPQADRARRVGMPVGAAGGSPLQNRSSYKPPMMMKRPPTHPLPSATVPVEGAVLRDVTAASLNVNANSNSNASAGGAGDVKRIKGGGGGGEIQGREGSVRV